MATLTFDVEITDENTGNYMVVEYEYDVYGLTQEEAEDLADEIQHGMNQDFYDEVMQNISITPRLVSIDDVDEDDD